MLQKHELAELHETYDSSIGVEDLREILSCHRLLKVWHDHSDIAGYPHLLVLVAAMYDPAFYFTPHKMQQKGADTDVHGDGPVMKLDWWALLLCWL